MNRTAEQLFIIQKKKNDTCYDKIVSLYGILFVIVINFELYWTIGIKLCAFHKKKKYALLQLIICIRYAKSKNEKYGLIVRISNQISNISLR